MTAQQKLALAIEALKYYGNSMNYCDTHKGVKPSFRVLKDDGENHPHAIYGGRRARQVLRELGVDMKYIEILTGETYEEFYH